MLTPHFSLEELMHSDTAVRLGINNTPSAEVIENLRVTAQSMECVRKLLGGFSISVNSGFRCEELERIISDKDYRAWCERRALPVNDGSWATYFASKAHPKGWSVDWVCRSYGTPLEIVQHLANTDLRFDQLIMEGTWVHSSFDPRMRREVKTATFVNGTPIYTAGV